MKPVKVTIKDFQSIESLDLEISGFTCVTGPTNIGKSAIVRAISSAILNKSVVGSVRKGKKHCTVEVDGLKWEKGERVGRYWVPGEKDEHGNAKPRDGIGQGQTEVTELMGFRSVKVGDKYINPWLATQFDPIFLMQDSGPAVTDFISDISQLKVLQDAIIVCTRARQRLLQASKELEEELSSLVAKESSLSGLDNLLRAEKDILSQYESLERYRADISRLRHLISSMDSEQALISALLPVKDVRVPKVPADPAVALMPVAKLWSELESAAMRISPIKGVMKVVIPEAPDPEPLEALRRTSRFLAIPALAASVRRLEAAETVRVPAVPEDVVPRLMRAARLDADIRAASSRVAALGKDIPAVRGSPVDEGLRRAAVLHRDIVRAEAAVAAREAQAAAVEAELKKVEAELSRIPTCPTCKQVFVRRHDHP